MFRYILRKFDFKSTAPSIPAGDAKFIQRIILNPNFAPLSAGQNIGITLNRPVEDGSGSALRADFALQNPG